MFALGDEIDSHEPAATYPKQPVTEVGPRTIERETDLRLTDSWPSVLSQRLKVERRAPARALTDNLQAGELRSQRLAPV